MLIGTREGVTRCYVVKRMADEERWSAEEVRELKGTPRRPNTQKVGLHIPTRMPVGEPPSGVADGDAAGGEEGIPPEPAPIPDPLFRRTPTAHNKTTSMDQHQDVLDANRRCEVKLREEGTQTDAEEGSRKR